MVWKFAKLYAKNYYASYCKTDSYKAKKKLYYSSLAYKERNKQRMSVKRFFDKLPKE
jgi:hypothetical protein